MGPTVLQTVTVHTSTAGLSWNDDVTLDDALEVSRECLAATAACTQRTNEQGR